MTLALDWLDRATAVDCDSYFARKAARDMGGPYGETLAASIGRLDRADAIYWQQRAKDNAALAAYALHIGALSQAAEFQRATSYFAAEALRSLSRLIESGSEAGDALETEIAP